MLTAITKTVLVILACVLASGQAIDKPFTFDAASVKPASPNLPGGRIVVGMLAPTGGPGTKDPGRIHYPRISLKYLLINAYGVNDYQISGPDWLDTEFFGIEATMSPDTTKEQFRAMLQNLLADRFKLKIHREAREGLAYSLVVAKDGPKMKESVEIPAAQDDGGPKAPPQRPQIGTDG
jgi:uncharacterized protein (TIGR03435 family)